MAKSKKDKLEYGKKYLEKLLSHVPEEQRATVLEALSSEAVQEAAGEDVLRQEDYSREMNTTVAEKQAAAQERIQAARLQQQLNDWYQENKAALDEYVEMKKRGVDDNENPAPKIDMSKYVDKDLMERTIAAQLNQFGQGALQVAALLPRLALRHYKDFNEELDTDALIQHSRNSRIPLDKGAYEDFIKDKLETKREADINKRIKDAREEGRSAALRESNIPYPVGGEEPSTMSPLFESAKDNGKYGVNAALEYLQELRKNA